MSKLARRLEQEGLAALDAAAPRDRVPCNLRYVCMTRYDKDFALPYVVPPESLDNILANVPPENIVAMFDAVNA